MKRVILSVFAILVTACATGYHPAYRFKQVQVVNLTGDTIENVNWRVIDSGKSQSCSEVANHAMCHDYFGYRRYPQTGIEVSWVHTDGEQRRETLNPHVPAYFSTTFPLRIVMEIGPDAAISASYQQDEPGDNLFTIK